jgi:hypothetical protein
MSDTSSPSSSFSASSHDGWSSRSDASSPDSTYSDQASVPGKTTSEIESQAGEFFFVDPMENGKISSQFKQKQAFLMKRYHRERKQAAIQRLKSAKAAPVGKTIVLLNRSRIQDGARYNSNNVVEDQPADDAEETVSSSSWVSTAYLSQGFKDPFDTYAVSMTDSMHRYLNHCMWNIHLTTLALSIEITNIEHSPNPRRRSRIPAKRDNDGPIHLAKYRHYPSPRQHFLFLQRQTRCNGRIKSAWRDTVCLDIHQEFFSVQGKRSQIPE